MKPHPGPINLYCFSPFSCASVKIAMLVWVVLLLVLSNLVLAQPPHKPKAFTPEVVRFGATVSDTESALKDLCKTIKTRRIHPPFLVLRDIKDKQIQIDCDGFDFLGKARWAEFVFGDDSLEMVWIMTTAEEEKKILRIMTKANGPPTLRNEKFIAFPRSRTALRTDVPEVLFYSEKLAARILPWFEKNTAFK